MYMTRDKDLQTDCCNKEMVELEKPSETDSQELFGLIQNHYHATESTKALRFWRIGRSIEAIYKGDTN